MTSLALAAVVLTGCAGGPSFDGEDCAGAFTGDLTKLATVTGDLGSEPDVTLRTPIHQSTETVEERIVGHGQRLTTGDQIAAVDVVLYNGTSGDKVVATEFDGDLSRLSNIDSWNSQVPAVASALHCASEGSRLVAAFPGTDLGEQGMTGLGVAKDDSVVAVIDVLKVYLPHAEGTEQYNDALGLPTVVRAPDGQPGIIVPDAKAPTDLVVQTLIKGDGEKVTGEEPIRVHYTGVTWDERTVFDTTWGSNPAKFDLTQVIEGFAKGLTGQTVGSQVLLVIPPELGYGDQAQGSIPANSTLVFVVDILGVDPAGTASSTGQ
ncbi:FKBP-type peptidyl-prolyl cis-trans isomerase [Microbacterium pseudoresistens]